MSINKVIVEQVSPFDVPTTVEKLIAAATKKEWQNPAVHNLQQSLAKSGKEVRPVQVIEICKPEFSGKMLERNDERIISILMPCRISVYEKADGKIYVATVNVKSFTEGQSENIQKVMLAAADELEEIVRSVAR